jgi:hypothetical protein
MIYPVRIERGGTALDSVNDVTLGDEELRQVSPVLARYTGNQRSLRQAAPFKTWRGD